MVILGIGFITLVGGFVLTRGGFALKSGCMQMYYCTQWWVYPWVGSHSKAGSHSKVGSHSEMGVYILHISLKSGFTLRGSSTSSSNWILMSCQPHRVTSGKFVHSQSWVHAERLVL